MANSFVDQMEALRDANERKWQPVLESVLTDLSDEMMADFERSKQVAQLPVDATKRISEALVGLWMDASQDAGKMVMQEFKDGYQHLDTKEAQTFFERIAQAFIQQFGADKVVRIARQTRQVLRDAVFRGQRDGQGVDVIARDIADRVPIIARQRAALIARTETHSASQYASNETAKRSRRPLLKKWNSVEDTRTRSFIGDTIDEYSHRRMDEVTVPMDQPFKVPSKYGTFDAIMFPGDPAGQPGNTINCFLPGTKVRGEFVAGVRSFYAGDVIQMKTAGGLELTTTVNHPVMTDSGLVPAHMIREGTNLVTYSRQVENPVGVSANDNQLGEAIIEDVFRALSDFGHSRTSGVAAVDFHGDGQFVQGNVCVVRADRQLQFGHDAALRKVLDDFALKHANPARFSLRSGQQFTKGSLATEIGVMSRVGKALALIQGSASHALKHGLAFVSDLVSLSFYGALDNAAIQSGIGGNRLNALSGQMTTGKSKTINAGAPSVSLDTGCSERLFYARNAAPDALGNVLDRYAGLVKLDNVVSVVSKPYSGHVYDLQEQSGLMIAGGIMTSNCRCVQTYARAK